MRILLSVGVVLLSALCVSRFYLPAEAGQDPTVVGAGPWQAGRCYRVFPSDPDTFHLFKVLQNPNGDWVRVQSHPSSPAVPGMRQPAPLWLNTKSPFAVQEWPCD
jgi:hypothetical protein